MVLHSQIIGNGIPFVILHGFLGSGDNWKTLGNKFAEAGYNIHLVDLRNHGHSFHSEEFDLMVMSKDILEYCEHYKLEKIILLGHSLGGKVAMEFAVQHAEKISKLVIVDISPKAYPLHHQEILLALEKLNFTKIKSRGEAETELSKTIKDEGTLLFLLKNLYWKSKGQLGLRLNLPVLKNKISEIGKPLRKRAIFNGETLFLRGENSDYILDSDKKIIQQNFSNAIIETLPKAGHWLHAENPAGFYEIVMDFL